MGHNKPRHCRKRIQPVNYRLFFVVSASTPILLEFSVQIAQDAFGLQYITHISLIKSEIFKRSFISYLDQKFDC